MAWEVIKREDSSQGSDKPFIAISEHDIKFNAMFTRTAQLEDSKYVLIHANSEYLKLGFEFCDEEKPNSLKLTKNETWSGSICSGKGIVQKYSWLIAVAKLKNIQEKRFEPTKEGKLWVIQLCPAFEIKRARESADIPSDLQGIYRYLRESGEIVYIGRGNIKERLMSLERKDWDFDKIEYSKVDNPDQQVKWENYWIDRYVEEFGKRPFYNKISGSDNYNDKK